ncbi:MAG: sugar kinase [Armatimonadetes bacterium]|nr:sugar kinase [Armatimonadota bacterium]
MPDVICLGILVADIVGKPVDQWPGRGKLVLVDRIELHSGGCAANTGVSLAKIGIPTGVMGKVGSDGFGDFMVNAFQSVGIDTRGVARDRGAATSSTMVMVHGDGERSFIHYIGANATFTPEDVNLDLIRECRLLHIAGTLLMPKMDGQPVAEILKFAQGLRITTTLDTVMNPKSRWMEDIAPCLPYVDFAVPSIEEAKMCTGREDPRDIAGVFMDCGVRNVALKMGDQGCYIRTPDAELSIPIYRVSAIDALGAGDAFAAGFVTGLIEGWDLERTGRFANAVGALCVTALGATTGVRSLNETLEFMKQHAL